MILSSEKYHQILSYIVHAWEILEEEQNFPKKHYKHIFVPSGHELYTGLLKASAYLFLDKKISKFLVFRAQNDFPDELISYKDWDFSIRWKKIKNRNILKLEENTEIPNEYFEQLLYLRILSQIQEVSLIGVWKNSNIQTYLSQIPKDYWIIVLWNLSLLPDIQESKKEDQKMIDHILDQKIYKKKPSRIGNLYTEITKNNNKKSDLIVYIHSSDLWSTIDSKWYLSLAG